MKGWITNEKYSQTEEREWRTTKLGWWSQSGCLPISELGTWPMTRQKLHWSLKNRASVCPSLGVLLDMAQYLTVILIFAGWGNMDKMNQKRSGGFPNLSGKKTSNRGKAPSASISTLFRPPIASWQLHLGNRSTTFYRLGKVDIWIYPAWSTNKKLLKMAQSK